jgi:6-phospho-beta-glucosidase
VDVLPTAIPASGLVLTLVHLWFTVACMKLAVLGAGGFRTPAIYRTIAAGRTTTRYDEIALYDADSARLDRIEQVLADLDTEAGSKLPRRITTRLDEALEGADVVYCAVRVGGIDGRLVDETVAIEHGVIGQETTGAGGIAFALRTIPVVMEIAHQVERLAPGALFVNFTNPVGLVTEAVRRVLGDRVVGICDSPQDMCNRVAGALGRPVEDLWFDYFGINHLGWLRGVLSGGRDLLPGLLADDARVESFEEGRLFGADLLRSVGMVPVKPLYYYYHQRETIEAMEAGHVRAAYLRDTQNAFYAGGEDRPGAALADWERTLEHREARYMEEAWSGRPDAKGQGAAVREPGGYGGLALGLVDSLHSAEPRVLILDVANRSSLPFLDPEAVVEVPCVVSRGGIVPVAIGVVPMEAQGLILQVRAAERATIDAALAGSRRLAARALALHPLVPSVDVARQILDAYLGRVPGLAENLR